jgi:hypothetical protein
MQFNLTTSLESEQIEYINYAGSRPRFTKLCTNCDSYGFDRNAFKTLNEGANNLVFRAVGSYNSSDEETRLIFIDSKKPTITKTLPTTGFASGTFEVEFTEQNPISLIINYGNSDIGYRNYSVDLKDCTFDKKYNCKFSIELSDYDEQEIAYYAALTDIAGNAVKSTPRKLKVDISSPIINSVKSTIEGKSVTFTLNVTEAFFDSLNYIDNLEANPKEKTLCTKLVEGLCIKKISLSEGEHDITIIARDEAGNSANTSVFFFTDSKKPIIKKTSPGSGFASGLFEIEFEEANPSFLLLNYGTDSEIRTAVLDLNLCTQTGRKTNCSVFVNLVDFEEQEINYQFNLTDKAGSSVLSKEKTLAVDTIPPAVNFFNYTISDKTVTFTINLTEKNFDKVEYKDETDSTPRFKTLCSRLTSGGLCEKAIRFRTGSHVLDIQATDDAGNIAVVADDLGFILA